MRSICTMILGALLLLSQVLPTLAASISSEGDVLINRGQGFSPATAGQEIQPGDSILVNAGGNAKLSFPGGCAMQLATAGAYTVPTESECVTSQNSPSNATNNPPTIFNATNILIGAAVVGGIVAGALLAGKDESAARPASP